MPLATGTAAAELDGAAAALFDDAGIAAGGGDAGVEADCAKAAAAMTKDAAMMALPIDFMTLAPIERIAKELEATGDAGHIRPAQPIEQEPILVSSISPEWIGNDRERKVPQVNGI